MITIDVAEIWQKKAMREDLMLKISVWKAERENELFGFLGESVDFVRIYKQYESDIIAAQAKIREIETNCKHELANPKGPQQSHCLICGKVLDYNNYGVTNVIN